MENVIKAINQRIPVLKRAIRQAEKAKRTFQIEGRLRISGNDGHPRYYHVDMSDSGNGKYIKKKDFELARALAMKDYTNSFLNVANAELQVLEQTAAQLSAKNADRPFQEMCQYRKDLLTPYILDDEQYAAEWQKKVINTSSFLEDEKKYETRHGEKVRSKSEAILTDLFYELGIPYHYEPALILNSGKIRYPDFVLLKKRTREEYYLEHFGLLDDDEYMKSALEKLDEYKANGIYLGINLLITYETADRPLDIKGIKKMLTAIFW